MRQIIFKTLILITFLQSSLFGLHLEYDSNKSITDNLSLLKNTSTQLNKKTLIMIYTDWCGYCTKQKNVFAVENIKNKYLDTKFVYMYINRNNLEKTHKFYVNFIPTTFILDESFNVEDRLKGLKSEDYIKNNFLDY